MDMVFLKLKECRRHAWQWAIFNTAAEIKEQTHWLSTLSKSGLPFSKQKCIHSLHSMSAAKGPLKTSTSLHVVGHHKLHRCVPAQVVPKTRAPDMTFLLSCCCFSKWWVPLRWECRWCWVLKFIYIKETWPHHITHSCDFVRSLDIWHFSESLTSRILVITGELQLSLEQWVFCPMAHKETPPPEVARSKRQREPPLPPPQMLWFVRKFLINIMIVGAPTGVDSVIMRSRTGRIICEKRTLQKEEKRERHH